MTKTTVVSQIQTRSGAVKNIPMAKTSRKNNRFKKLLENLRKSFAKKNLVKLNTNDTTSCTSSISYETINFQSKMTNKKFRFKCFEEKKLNFPSLVTQNVIERSCDDDIVTDDEQIEHAIKNLYCSLKEGMKKRKMIKK